MDITSLIQSASLIIAAWTVILGINAWRREYVGKKNLELAEDVLAMFYEARDAISAIRNPFSYGTEGSTRKAAPDESPEDKVIYDRAYIAFERYNKNQEVFNKLHSMRYRYIARFGENSAKPFDDLRGILNEIFVSAQMLTLYWKEQRYAAYKKEEELQKHLDEMRKHEANFWYQGTKDVISTRLDAVISEIESQSAEIISEPHWLKRIYNWLTGE